MSNAVSRNRSRVGREGNVPSTSSGQAFCCPPIVPVPRGQTMEPFAHLGYGPIATPPHGKPETGGGAFEAPPP